MNDSTVAENPKENIGVKDCLLFLCGNRQAIEKLARSKSILPLGFFFVLIAAIAREYDQEYFFKDPHIFAIPFIASVAMCYLLRLFLQAYYRQSLNPEGLGSFRIFLGLFLMTAPCAWIYALPVERLFDSMTALKVNIYLLAFVAVWRVALFTRILKVLTGVNVIFGIFTMACPVIFIAAFFSNLNLMGIMSGGGRSEEQSMLLEANGMAGGIAFLAFVPVLVFYIIQARRLSSYRSFEKREKMRVSKTLLGSSVLLLVAALLMMVEPQNRQQRYFYLQNLINNKQYAAAVNYANSLEREQLPASRQIYPVLRYYGFDVAIALFSELTGDEKEWLQADIKQWMARGFKGRHFFYNVANSLKEFPREAYHLEFLKLHKEAIANSLQNQKVEALEEIADIVSFLEIEQPSKE